MSTGQRTLALREWEAQLGVSLQVAERDALREVFRAQIQPAAGSTASYDIRPQGRVGAVQVGSTVVVVAPKITISNVLFLMGYTADPRAWREDTAEVGNSPDLVSGVVDLYLLLVEKALTRGLLRGYQQESADLHTVQGRIDFARQLRTRPGRQLPIAVRRSRYDVDVMENRLLLAAASALDRLHLRSQRSRKRLRRIIDTMTGVSLQHFPPHHVPEVTWTRLNQHYRPAVDLARLLLDGGCPDVRLGSVTVRGLVLDMAGIFEGFVRVALREALGVAPREFPSGEGCPPLFLDRNQEVRLKPDLSLWTRGGCRFVGDAKYKRDPGPGRASDIYQLLAYATATQLPSATLIYAHGPQEPAWHEVPTAGIRIGVRHLDLSVPPEAILRQVNSLAAEIHQLGRVA